MANIPSLPDAMARMVDAYGRPTQEWYLLWTKFYPLLRLADSAVQEIPPVDPDTLYSDQTANLTVGYTATTYDAGTKSSGTFTPDPALGGFQKYVNGGAHTLGKPTSDCSLLILITNNGSAGTITTSAFAKVRGTLNTTNGAQFAANIVVVGGVGFLNIM